MSDHQWGKTVASGGLVKGNSIPPGRNSILVPAADRFTRLHRASFTRPHRASFTRPVRTLLMSYYPNPNPNPNLTERAKNHSGIKPLTVGLHVFRVSVKYNPIRVA